MSKSLVFSIDTRVSGDADANPMDENVTPAHERCPLSVFLALVRGVGKLCNYSRAVNTSAVTVKCVWWQEGRPEQCFVETHLSSAALSWVEMLQTGLHPSHILVRMFEEKHNLRSMSSHMRSTGVESWPPSNVHTKTVSAMMNASVLTLTREQKRRLWFGVERKEAYMLLWMLKAAEVKAGASKFVFTEYRALDQQLRRSHRDIAKFVDDKTKDQAATSCRETQHAEKEPSPGTGAKPPHTGGGAKVQFVPQAASRHIMLSEAQLLAKKDNETITATSSESESTCSGCSSPRIEPEAAVTPPPLKRISRQSMFSQDLMNLRNCNFPKRAKTTDRVPMDSDWTSTGIHRLGLIWDPCFLDGGFVLKPRNFPAHFKVGTRGVVSIW